MKRYFHFVLCVFLITGVSDIIARGSSSSSSSSSRSSSSSFRSSSSSSFRSSSSTPKTTTVKSTPPKTSSTFGTRNQTGSSFSTTQTTTKPKAVSQNKLDRQMNKVMAQQNTAAVKTYGTKAAAEAAFKQKMASTNNYTNSVPPTTTPDYIPKTVTVNNSSVPVTYGKMSNGSYGYGHYDPITHVFVSLAVADMITDNMVMAHHGYGEWDGHGKPVVHTTSTTPISGTAVVVSLLIVAGVVITIVFFVRKFA